MKKTISLLCMILVIISFATACGKRNVVATEPENTSKNQENPGEWTEQITKDGESVTKLLIGENEYELNYLTDDGGALKTEHYVNDKLVYYYVYSEQKGDLLQNYYNADNKLIAVVGSDGSMKDGNGKDITENEIMKILSDCSAK